MIELFSKKPYDLNLKFDNGLIPIHIDESIISLSAILLNDVYYDSLVKEKRTVDGYSIIEIETVILFQTKAWLDMKARKAVGAQVDSKNIKKHKNDVFRLLAYLPPSRKVETVEEIQNDIIQFIELINEDNPDLRSLGIRRTSLDELLEILGDIFLIDQKID